MHQKRTLINHEPCVRTRQRSAPAVRRRSETIRQKWHWPAERTSARRPRLARGSYLPPRDPHRIVSTDPWSPLNYEPYGVCRESSDLKWTADENVLTLRIFVSFTSFFGPLAASKFVTFRIVT
ncbi:hypothetical protein EVAR_27778_1 [Eumeta japonica]|uniref:Uncharacterized protein n=1 Tax=Eumeta variegata TaxID=151549 RepID=A0A4C1VC62_EUMVA|nr:hypothetical protein EVAR_27778_1 [Eumeta japonica]